MLARYKPSSILLTLVNYGCKKIDNIGPWTPGWRRLGDPFLTSLQIEPFQEALGPTGSGSRLTREGSSIPLSSVVSPLKASLVGFLQALQACPIRRTLTEGESSVQLTYLY